MKNLFTFILLLSFSLVQAQRSYNICDSLTTITQIPASYNVTTNQRLTPDACSAKKDYGTTYFQTLAPQPSYLQTQYKVREKIERIYDPTGCIVTENISRDTFDVISQVIEANKEYLQTQYVIRLEMLTYLPYSRPDNCYAILLNSGNYAGYYVTYYGQFQTKTEATQALKTFKTKYKEFCTAYVWQVPYGIDTQYKYKSKFNQVN